MYIFVMYDYNVLFYSVVHIILSALNKNTSRLSVLAGSTYYCCIAAVTQCTNYRYCDSALVWHAIGRARRLC